jgi:riboflavin kinase/FMN adenylyltransferase
MQPLQVSPSSNVMKIIRAANELNAANRKVCVAIGMFDGVHLGHQQVIRQTLNDAEQHEALAVVITFDKHPNVVVAPERVPALIYSLPQKLRAITALGVDTTWLIAFDQAFSRQTGEDFVRALVRGFGHLCSVCVGATFTFGYKRSGNVALLRKLGEEFHFTVHGLSAVALDGEVISSTRIRDAIRAGRFEAASQMLGRGYSLAGIVVKGDQLGRTLGFPTANLDVTGSLVPPNGVYVVHALVQGQSHRAVLNIGFRPTVQDAVPQLRVEAHLPGFNGDLYGQELEVSFVGRLRDEQKFPTLDDLKRQVRQDIADAQRLFES